MSEIELTPEELEYNDAKRGFVDRATNCLRAADDAKEDFKTVLEEAKKAGFTPKEIRVLATHNFKNQAKQKIAELTAVDKELDRLYGEY